MKNIEIKGPLPDRPRVERALVAMGARETWVRAQRDTFYTVPHGWLKLREQDGVAPELISYVRTTETADPRPSSYDVATLDDAELWHRLLGRALDVDAVVEKERTLWLWRRTRIHLDRVGGLGDYLELECVLPDAGEEDGRRETDEVIAKLGLDRRRFIASPYRDLIRFRAAGARSAD